MNKKGQGGLSMNTIIIAIIGIIVLLLIVTFFTGGMATVFGKIKGVFGGGTAGSDMALSRSFCESYCQTAKLNKDKIGESTYCNKKFDVEDSQGNPLLGQSCIALGVECVIDGKTQTC
tara:strand:- start:1100 stop:1453 length:354 start_codon:yes stop_codon:yes gene_type:complete